MDAKENGAEQAYPRAGYDGPDHSGAPKDGTTKREAFALGALQAIIGFHGVTGIGDISGRETGALSYKDAAQYAVAQADALLAELAK